MDTVTKEKHPGRVAQGHKLAALMKQRKEELKQNKKSEQETVHSSELTQNKTSEQSSYKAVYASGGAVIIIAAAWFFWSTTKKPSSPPPAGDQKKKAVDIFAMR